MCVFVLICFSCFAVFREGGHVLDNVLVCAFCEFCLFVLCCLSCVVLLMLFISNLFVYVCYAVYNAIVC